MEAELERSKAELAKARKRAAELEKQVEAGEARVSKARAEIVPYGAYETEGIEPVKIPVKRSGD
jgi:multidrug resistance efflux pump